VVPLLILSLKLMFPCSSQAIKLRAISKLTSTARNSKLLRHLRPLALTVLANQEQERGLLEREIEREVGEKAAHLELGEAVGVQAAVERLVGVGDVLRRRRRWRLLGSSSGVVGYSG
jgi:hypothetical protein